MIGPVQLVVLGFNKPDFKGEILAEFERLRASDTVRLVDSLTVYKDSDGEVSTLEVSQLSQAEAIEFGAVVGALIGLGAGGDDGVEIGAEAGAEAGAEGLDFFSDQDAWDVLKDIPNDSAAALVLLEHRWAVPVRDAIVRAGGFPVSDGFISPLDLVAVGLLSAAEAETLAASTQQKEI
ncbi:hypothetical protein [Jiangella aurantiaca]|uniref:hypothetical protein n=1 Tax=Jiangella aurantiaca TaxID=2530373 RepID=UPI00193D2A56|nr:hypothetical protein [Jiangella aurantiaca]